MDGKRTSALWIVGTALLAGAALAWPALDDPTFHSDAGYRAYYADRPVVKLGNRIWLPFLQAHIRLYHALGLPVEGLKLITVAYFTMGLVCLGLYWRRVLGSDASATAAAAAATLCFAASSTGFGTAELMQERAGVGLLFLFAWLASRDRPLPWIALPAGCAAMLARDAYWIYLFAATLVDPPKRSWSRRRIAFYAALWLTPVVWLAVCVPVGYWVVYQRLPSFPVEWPLMYNPADRDPSFGETFTGLAAGLLRGRGLFIGTGVAAAWLVLLWAQGRRFLDASHGPRYAAVILRAAPAAMVVVYGLILAVDPWRATPGASRQSWPVTEVGFLVAPLLLRAAAKSRASVRWAVGLLIVAGLLGGVRQRPVKRLQQDGAAIRAEHRKLRRFLDPSDERRPADVCLLSVDRWRIFADLTAPTFYDRRTIVAAGEPLPESCRILVADDDAERPFPGFESRFPLDLREADWTVYERLRPD